MENELYMLKDSHSIDSQELLTRFIYSCKKTVKDNGSKSPLLSFADIVTAVYYYRKYPDINQFVVKYLTECQDYFMLQWVRSTWASLDKMSPEEISNLVINQITLVANSIDEQ